MYLVLLREEFNTASVNCSSLLIEFLNVDMQQNSILPLFLRPNPYGLILGHRPTPSLSFWLFLSQTLKIFKIYEGQIIGQICPLEASRDRYKA